MAAGTAGRYLDIDPYFYVLCRVDFYRKQLIHRPPDWVQDGEPFFITICLKDRQSKLLVQPNVSAAIREAMAFYQNQGYWWIELILLMPDHLHALISFNQREKAMSRTLQSWKRYLSRSQGIGWQRGYFDHRLRTDNAAREKSSYIRNNPVRAGLVEKAEDWPHVWTGDSFKG